MRSEPVVLRMVLGYATLNLVRKRCAILTLD